MSYRCKRIERKKRERRGGRESRLKKVILSVVMLAFILSAPAIAATRFYLPTSAEVAAVSPSFTVAGWSTSEAADRGRCVLSRLNTVMTTKESVPVKSISCLNRQYVSDPLAPITISGKVRGQVLGIEASNAAKLVSAVAIRLVKNDGTDYATVKTLLALTIEATEYTTSWANRYTPNFYPISTGTAESGDRLVIEIGYSSTNPATKGGSQMFGDNAATDLPIDETSTAALNPWIEFDQNIIPSATIID